MKHRTRPDSNEEEDFPIPNTSQKTVSFVLFRNNSPTLTMCPWLKDAMRYMGRFLVPFNVVESP